MPGVVLFDNCLAKNVTYGFNRDTGSGPKWIVKNCYAKCVRGLVDILNAGTVSPPLEIDGNHFEVIDYWWGDNPPLNVDYVDENGISDPGEGKGYECGILLLTGCSTAEYPGGIIEGASITNNVINPHKRPWLSNADNNAFEAISTCAFQDGGHAIRIETSTSGMVAGVDPATHPADPGTIRDVILKNNVAYGGLSTDVAVRTGGSSWTTVPVSPASFESNPRSSVSLSEFAPPLPHNTLTWFCQRNGQTYTRVGDYWVGGTYSEHRSSVNFALGSSYAAEQGVECVVPVYAAASAAGCHAGHPSVVHIPYGFGGYTYWMAFTPLKAADNAAFENPSVVASNDGVHWEVPIGLNNPVIDAPSAGFNADTNLTWEGNRLVLLYTLMDANYTTYATVSLDGLFWSIPSVVLQTVTAVKIGASPSLYRDFSGGYKLWNVNVVPAMNVVELHTSGSIEGPWVTTACTIDPVIDTIWHMEVHYFNGRYVMLADCMDFAGRHTLAFLTSGDGLAWEISADFPMALAAGQFEGGTADYYKSACVLGDEFGAGNAGFVWHTPSTYLTMRRAPLLSSNPADQPAGYCDMAIAGAVANESPYVLGDTFSRANGDLIGSTPDSGSPNWLAYSNHVQIDNHKIKMGSPHSFAVYPLASATGVVGMRVSSCPVGAAWELEFRSNRSIGGSNKIGLYYVSRTFYLRLYNGSANVALAQWPLPVLGSGALDGAEFSLEVRNGASNTLVVTARMNGRTMASATVSSANKTLLTGTDVAIYIGDTGTRIDSFFAHT